MHSTRQLRVRIISVKVEKAITLNGTTATNT